MTTPQLDDHKISLLDNDTQDLAGPLDFLRMYTASGPLEFDVGNGTVQLQQGDRITLRTPIDKVIVRNKSGSTVNAFVQVGLDSDVETTGTVTLEQGTALDDPTTVVVGAVALQLVAASPRKSVRFHNDGPGTVYLGNATVTTANGIPLEPGATWIENDIAAAVWFAIAAAAGNTVRVQSGS